MIESIIFFIVSLLVLVKASHLSIDQAVKISEHLSTTHFVVGFVLIAVTTSLPELFISGIATLSDQGAIGIGNVIGSNIANIALVLGIISFFGVIKIVRKEMIENAEILLFISFFPAYLLIRGSIGTASGIFLLSLFFAYCVYLFKRKGATAVHYVLDTKTKRFVKYKERKPKFKIIKTFVLFFVGVAIIIISANFLIKYALEIIDIFMIPPSFMAVTLIAAGTSLPELVIGVSAMRKKYASLALGTIIGSCVINLTLVLGSIAILSPVRMRFDLFTSALTFLIIINVVLLYSLIKFRGIPRKIGIVFLIIYTLFILSGAGILVL